LRNRKIKSIARNGKEVHFAMKDQEVHMKDLKVRVDNLIEGEVVLEVEVERQMREEL